jgi:Protein of unknown function (DUF732)
MNTETRVIADDTATVDRAALAWSEDDQLANALANSDASRLSNALDNSPDQPLPRVVVAALVVLVATMGVAVIALGAMLFNEDTPSPVVPVHVPATAAPAPRPVVTWPTIVMPAPPVSDTDRAFLDDLKRQHVTYPSDAYAITTAHNTCQYLASHSATETDTFVQRTTLWTDHNSANGFVGTAQMYYCPQEN